MINILIVDDDIATLEVIRDSVNWEKLGVKEVRIALNVSSAKQIFNETPIDIVISDIEMPQESGIDFLRWVREENKECEFLFLTCHESFQYASHAISYNAAAYLTKPFDIEVMELTLQKIIVKIRQARELKKSSELGIWMEKNHRFVKLNFWKTLLDGDLIGKHRICEEIKRRHLDIEYDHPYYLVCTRLSNMESDIEKYGKDVFEFVLESFHMELLTGKVMNDSVVKYTNGEVIYFITICLESEQLKEECQKLIEISKNYFKGTITCCVSTECMLDEFNTKWQKLKKIFDYNISHFGTVFGEEDAEAAINNNFQIIELDQLIPMVEHKQKAQILHYLKHLFDELAASKHLNVHTLYLMKQEIIQVVYADLMKYGIQATKLFYDDCSIKIEEHALESTVDMIRWVNYLLEKTYQYEDEIAKNATLVGKINDYIHQHYAEDIGRCEIASSFFLTPEYLAKMYKKKTGVNLKDYINEYRIEKAKELLLSGEVTIGDVAERVGFDNFSYFSTLFKKFTGQTPKDYKMQERQSL